MEIVSAPRCSSAGSSVGTVRRRGFFRPRAGRGGKRSEETSEQMSSCPFRKRLFTAVGEARSNPLNQFWPSIFNARLLRIEKGYKLARHLSEQILTICFQRRPSRGCNSSFCGTKAWKKIGRGEVLSCVVYLSTTPPLPLLCVDEPLIYFLYFNLAICCRLAASCRVQTADRQRRAQRDFAHSLKQEVDLCNNERR